MSPSNAIFLFIFAIAAGFFALSVQRLIQYMRLGLADPRTDHPLTRLKNVLTIGIAQTKIFRDPIAGPMHDNLYRAASGTRGYPVMMQLFRCFIRQRMSGPRASGQGRPDTWETA